MTASAPIAPIAPIPINAFNPGLMTGAGNWTWLLPGRVPTLVDAGVGDPRHLDALEEALGGAVLAQVLVTHGHSDHASGVAAIAGRMPHVRFLKRPWPRRDGLWPVRWDPIADGDAIDAGDTSVMAVHTPGHAPDHLCFWQRDTRTMFSGDLAIEGTTVWIPSSLEGDLAAYMASLDLVLALNPARMFPAHGPVIERPAALLRSYLAHRREREGQILGALRRGDARTETIVARVYPGLNEGLVPRARETVGAHLQKLEREGMVGRSEDAWHIIET